MKRGIIIVSLFVAGIFVSHAQEYCDTLKLKVTKTYYADFDGSNYNTIGALNNAKINIDTLSDFYIRIEIVNISNDTFSANDEFVVLSFMYIYADTGFLGGSIKTIQYYFVEDFFPNDSKTVLVGLIDLQGLVNSAKETFGVDLEQINYWKTIIGIDRTSKEGYYSDSAFIASADTSIFYVVKTPVGIQEKENHAIVSVFPNPAQTQFTVTNTENATIQLFNMLGQEILQVNSTEENTVINVDFLPQGIYVLKVLKDNNPSVHKIQIVR